MPQLTHEESLAENLIKPGPVLRADLTGKTVIIIGANTGLGFETAKHLATMNPARLILACRNKDKGEAALQSLVESTRCTCAELWLIDLTNFASIKAFADKVNSELNRIDILIENAAVGVFTYSVTIDGWETSIQTNDLGLALLSLLLLPKLVEAARRFSILPRLVAVSSDVHYWVPFGEDLIQAANIHKKISSEEYYTSALMSQGPYALTKLLNVFFIRALHSHLPKTNPPILVNMLSPGFCYSDLRRSATGDRLTQFQAREKQCAFTAEEGSRHIVYAALKGLGDRDEEEKLNGVYLTFSKVRDVSDFVLSEVGGRVQDRLWDEKIDILSDVDDRVRTIVEQYLV